MEVISLVLHHSKSFALKLFSWKFTLYSEINAFKISDNLRYVRESSVTYVRESSVLEER